MSAASSIVDYFANVLQRGRLEPVKLGDRAHVAVARGELEAGELSPRDTKRLFDAHGVAAAGTRQARGADSAQGDDAIPVVISLVTLVTSTGPTAGLLLLEASLTRAGRLTAVVEPGASPWIPLERLSQPASEGLSVMVGTQQAFGGFARQRFGAEAHAVEGFGDALALASTMFAAVSGDTPSEYANRHGNAKVDADRCFIAVGERVFAAGPLIDVYEAMRDSSPLPGAAHALVETGVRAAKPRGLSRLKSKRAPGVRAQERQASEQIHSAGGLLALATQACGSMTDAFPMAPSQRRALHCFLAGDGGDVTAVNGPPGTGKTTLLQSVVANLITRRALERGDAPIIVGGSTNNQAVTNIIESFASVTKPTPGTLDQRWLPEAVGGSGDPGRPLSSLAVYCPAQAGLAKARKQYLVEQRDKSETYATYSDPDYLHTAEPRYVERAAAYFKQVHEPAEIREWLHDALAAVDELRCALLRVMAAEGPSSAYFQLCDQAAASPHLAALHGIDALRDCASLDALDAALDVTLRYAQFWLAVHYFEAEWLLTADFVTPDERFKTTADVMERYWRQAAALTPCFVMTLYQLPKYFARYAKPGEPRRFDFERIDLLIVDEAGQVDTPLGVPAFALAKRALVVGDEHQLPPVWSVDEMTDQEVAAAAGVSESSWREHLAPVGLTGSAGSSLMRAASHGSRWSFGDGIPGVLLTEHYRCHPDIIGYCNELLYGGLLQPQRPSSHSKLDSVTPAFGWISVPNSEDVRRGSSRVNQAEADAIAAWIVNNYRLLRDIYGDSGDAEQRPPTAAELIGVVTPFTAQAGIIELAIRQAFRAATTEQPDLAPGFEPRITVGTAHRLQGAERPVVLFSAVYGNTSDGAAFIEQNPELMNVAISRAKDLCIVFASARRRGTGNVFGLLARYTQDLGPTLISPDSHQGFTPVLTAGHAPVLTTGHIPGPVTVTARGQDPAAGSSSVAGIAVDTAPEVGATAEPEEPEEPEEPLATGAADESGPPVSISKLLQEWRSREILREDDLDLTPRQFNPRLKAAGVLEGEAGAWRPTQLAQLLGTVIEERGAAGASYDWLGYAPQMQCLLERLYRDGRL